MQVFDGVAERTGIQLDRAGVRGRRAVYRSLTALSAAARRLGDGYYYLVSAAWPEETDRVELKETWVSMA